MQVSFDALVAGVKAGKLVSFPTDTVAALATLPEQGLLIFAAKQRSQDKPLILMGASLADLRPYIKGSDDEYEIWQRIISKYWPGALTLVLPASDIVPKAMVLDQATIGVRVPDCAIALNILRQTGPLATTSANLSGQPPLQTTAEIEAQFPDVLTLATESQQEQQKLGVPSTVVKWTGKNWEILRQGGVKFTE
jgi:L-threonylcarbamoyladenylate synthase